MKKLLVLTLTALSITALVGCGAKNEQASNGENLTSNKNNIVESNENTSQNEIYFAKVKNIVGNEISVKLSDEKFQMEEGTQSGGLVQSFELDESQLAKLENGGTITLDDGGVMAQVTIDPDALEDFNSSGEAIIAEPSEGMEVTSAVGDGGISFGGGLDNGLDDSNMFSAIEFNGEDKELIVSAGTEIFNLTTGKIAKISDIKEGSILSIVIDSKTNKVTRIDIMG